MYKITAFRKFVLNFPNCLKLEANKITEILRNVKICATFSTEYSLNLAPGVAHIASICLFYQEVAQQC